MLWFIVLAHSVCQASAKPSDNPVGILGDPISVDQQRGLGGCNFTDDCDQYTYCVNIQVIEYLKNKVQLLVIHIRMRAANAILVNVSMMETHLENLEPSARTLKIVQAAGSDGIPDSENDIRNVKFSGEILNSVSAVLDIAKKRRGSVT